MRMNNIVNAILKKKYELLFFRVLCTLKIIYVSFKSHYDKRKDK